MSKIKLSLRMKVTLVNTIVLIFCSIILASAMFFSAGKTIDSISVLANDRMMLSQENVSSINSTPSEIRHEAALTSKATTIEKQNLGKSILIYMILVIILGVVITYLITGKSLKSLRQLKDEIKDVSEHNLSKEIEEKGADDEIKELTKSFNNMLRRIDNAFEEQKKFSANVAHELRTPLAVIRMKLDVFKKVKNKDVEDYEKVINVIEKNNDRLSNIVEELLSICNQEEISINEKIDLDKIITLIEDELKDVAVEKNISIDKHINIDKSVVFLGNEQLIYSAMYNLVENSIKYNRQNGKISIKVNNDSNFLNIVIEDTGIGIQVCDYENIFKPFYRVDKSRSRKIGGAGLGLSIVNNIIKRHNGKIKVESSDVGSKFIINIPLV